MQDCRPQLPPRGPQKHTVVRAFSGGAVGQRSSRSAWLAGYDGHSSMMGSRCTATTTLLACLSPQRHPQCLALHFLSPCLLIFCFSCCFAKVDPLCPPALAPNSGGRPPFCGHHHAPGQQSRPRTLAILCASLVSRQRPVSNWGKSRAIAASPVCVSVFSTCISARRGGKRPPMAACFPCAASACECVWC